MRLDYILQKEEDASSKYWIVGSSKTYFGSYDFEVDAIQIHEVYTNKITQLLQRVHTINTTDFWKALTTWEAFPRPQQRWLQCGLHLKTERAPRQTWTLSAPPAQCVLWRRLRHLAEVIGLPSSPTKTFLCATLHQAQHHEVLRLTFIASRVKMDTCHTLMSI